MWVINRATRLNSKIRVTEVATKLKFRLEGVFLMTWSAVKCRVTTKSTISLFQVNFNSNYH